MMRKWMAYNYAFLEEEEIIRITNEEFVPIRRDDLDGNIDIDITISTAEDNSAKAQELSFLLQTMGPNQDFEINKLLMGQIAKLSRMPDLEKQIMNYQPQPDPMAEQAKQIEMQKMMLDLELMQAEIADKKARAGENLIDATLKANKARVEEAKARKLLSESDRIDLDFLKANEGIPEQLDLNKLEMKRQAEVEDRDVSRLHELDKVALQAMLKPKEKSNK
jgi:hypothetical protein